MKENSKCYALFVNVTNDYISFKIARATYLGEAKVKSLALSKFQHIVEMPDDMVQYMSMDDIFPTEDEAIKALTKMLNKKVRVK